MSTRMPFIAHFVEDFSAITPISSFGTKTANREGPDDYVGASFTKTLTETKEQPDPGFGSASAATQTLTFTSKETPDADFGKF